jgi:hypothetical protein
MEEGASALRPMTFNGEVQGHDPRLDGQSLLMLMKMNPLVPLLHFCAEAGEDLACPRADDAEADG